MLTQQEVQRLGSILVLYCCFNNLPQTQWIKTDQAYYFTYTWVVSLRGVSLGYNQDIIQTEILSPALEQELSFLAEFNYLQLDG